MKTISRREFLELTGITAGALALITCIESCKKSNTAPQGPSNVDFSLDLSDPANSILNSPGKYLYNQGVIVARGKNSNFIAVAATCTHEGGTVIYQSGDDNFYCTLHGSLFKDDGSVQRGPAAIPLKQYTCTLSGNVLHVKGG
jgi:cytochrome b6-f complex iron-sulfur subunit